MTSLIEIGDGQVFRLRKHLVERFRLRSAWRAAAFMSRRFEEIPQALELLGARRIVHAIDEGRRFASRVSAAATLAWIMNSSMRRWASSRCGVTTRSTRPLSSSTILRSGRSRSSGPRLSRAAATALVGRPQRLQTRCRAAARHLSDGAPVDRRLRLLVGKLGGRAHHAAHEGVAALFAVLVEHHAHGEAGPLLAVRAASRGRSRSSPAASARRGRGSRPSCRAAALRGRASSRAHVMGDVGDGDGDDPAAGVLRIAVGLPHARRRRGRARRQDRW